MLKEIKKYNDENFIADLKRVRDVLVYAQNSGTMFKVCKREVMKEAAIGKIDYYISDKIFVRKRDVMVIL